MLKKKGFPRRIPLAEKKSIIFRSYFDMERKSSSSQRVFYFTFTCDVLRLISDENYAGASQVPSSEKFPAIF